MPTINPAEITRITYEDSRSRMVETIPAEQAALCCPPWEDMNQTQRDAMISATTSTLNALRANGYDIVQVAPQ